METKIKIENNDLIVKIIGDIDEHNAPKLRNSLDEAIMQNRFKRLVLDLSMVMFMDSTGIGVMLGRYKLIKERYAEMCVINVSEHINKIMKMSGLYQIIKTA